MNFKTLLLVALFLRCGCLAEDEGPLKECILIPPAAGPNLQPEVILANHGCEGYHLLYGGSPRTLGELWYLLENYGVHVYLSPEVARSITTNTKSNEPWPDRFKDFLMREISLGKPEEMDTVKAMVMYLDGVRAVARESVHYEPLTGGGFQYRKRLGDTNFRDVTIASGKVEDIAAGVLDMARLHLGVRQPPTDILSGWEQILRDTKPSTLKVDHYYPDANLLLFRSSEKGADRLVIDFGR